MDRLIYLSMAGAKATMQRQEVLAHNLANASTSGFRAQIASFQAVPIAGDRAGTRVYTLETTLGHDDTPGVMQSTGRPLDVAMRGKSWLAVQGLDGVEGYTRAGSLTTSPEGLLTTSTGLTVLGDGGPITVPANASVSIAPDGSVSAGTGNGAPQVVGRLKLVTPEGPLERDTDGLFRSPQGDLPADATARVEPGVLEGSNVSAVESMVAMISAARQFEHQMKMLQGAEQRDQAAARLLGQ